MFIEKIKEIDPDEAHPIRLVEGLEAYELEIYGMVEGIVYINRVTNKKRV